ncbi:MAG: M56 family metallopeptidase [Clostridia bacterium]|nr:M56 family metallopeptidase [Clostridia bacterium]
MADFFSEILNMSINASWLILAVILYRLVFIRSEFPKWCRGFLWAMVGIRLVFPFSVEFMRSLIPTSARPIPQEIIHAHTPDNISGAEILGYIGNNPVSYSIGIQDGSIIFNEYCAPDVETVNPLLIIMTVASIIWVIGFAALMIYAVISYLKLKNGVRDAVILRDGIYQSEKVESPFILGFIKPKIYIPYGLSEETLQHVEAHENAHLKRFDHITKMLGFLILCVHWFNPLVWISYNLFCKDIELACDEKVIRNMEIEKRKEYANAILECGIRRQRIAACPLAFGETSIKQRVRNTLKYKKPAVIAVITAMLMCILVVILFMTNPENPEDKSASKTYVSTDSGASHEGVRMTVTDLRLDGDDPTVTVELSNKLKNGILFGEVFDLLYFENGRWVSCLKPDTENYFQLPLYMLNPEAKKEMVYHIKNFNLSRSGDYRVVVNYELDIYQDMSRSVVLTAYAGFSLSEAVAPNTTNPFPLEPESVTANNEFLGIQSSSIPYSEARSEKYPIPDGYDDVPIYAGASNREKLYISSIQHLPTHAVRSVEELENYKRITLGTTEYSEHSMLNDYDEAFFKDNMLIMINTLEANKNFAYGLIGVYSSGSDVWVLIEKTHPKKYDNAERAYGTNIAIEVRKDHIPKAQTFDAWIEKNTLMGESNAVSDLHNDLFGEIIAVNDNVIVIKPDEGEVIHINGTWMSGKNIAVREYDGHNWQVGDRVSVIYSSLYEGADSTVIGVKYIIRQ